MNFAILMASLPPESLAVPGLPLEYTNISMTLGILLGASLIAGLVGEMLRLPKVTAYLLAGLVLGPSVLNFIPESHQHSLEPLTRLAMALVLFYLGTQFPIAQIKRVAKKATILSAGELTCTFLLVTVGLLLFGMPSSNALLLGALALATAPATTMLVLRETSAEGPVTNLTGTLVAMNNVVAIIAFEFVWIIIQLTSGQSEGSISSVAVELGRSLGGAVLLGFVGGLVISYSCELMQKKRWLVLLISVSALLLGVTAAFDLPYMVTFLMLGIVVVNSSSGTEKITSQLDSIGGLLTVVFFAVHGAELDLNLLWGVGAAGAAYIVLRSVGKIAGTWIAATKIKASSEVRTWLGPALLAQAGVAISLSSVAADRDASFEIVQTIILGTVVVFEIIGPLLTRMAVLKSGEMPIANSIHHTFGTPFGALKNVFTRLAGSTGLLGKGGLSERMKVEQVMRRSVEGIAESASFNDVVYFVEHSHDNTFPVLDSQHTVVGLIRFDLLNQAFFDPHSDHILCAADLATPPQVLLHPSQPVHDAVELFQQTTDDVVPVVADAEPHVLVGTVRRSDLTSLLIRDRMKRQP